MPAHRSEAEAEIREAVVARLRHIRPGARIIHEINAGGGTNRIDVMAVDRAEIIAVEIKSKRDKLDRLPDQIAAMKNCSHTTIAALHRKFMPEVTDRSFPRVPEVPWGVLTWFYPRAQDMAEAHHRAFLWEDPPVENFLQAPLPEGALWLLHRHEMEAICADLKITPGRRPNMRHMARLLRWNATGRDLTTGICAALRRREWAAEADPPIDESHDAARA